MALTDKGEDSRLVHRRKRSEVDASIFVFFFRRVRATSMTQRRVEKTRVHFWMLSPVSVNIQEFRKFFIPLVYLELKIWNLNLEYIMYL